MMPVGALVRSVALRLGRQGESPTILSMQTTEMFHQRFSSSAAGDGSPASTPKRQPADRTYPKKCKATRHIIYYCDGSTRPCMNPTAPRVLHLLHTVVVHRRWPPSQLQVRCSAPTRKTTRTLGRA